jgi:hypothetical protein
MIIGCGMTVNFLFIYFYCRPLLIKLVISNVKTARTLSHNGKLTLQKYNILPAWRLSEKVKTQITVAW